MIAIFVAKKSNKKTLYLQSMKKYFITGNILWKNEEVPRIEIGDSICFDKLCSEKNGRFKTLSQFKEWLSLNFEFQHLIGEEYADSICIYKILSIHKKEFCSFKTQSISNSILNYPRLLNL
ncbi:MAG: hypothetical protein ABI390_11605 [Daejeonella sp.]